VHLLTSALKAALDFCFPSSCAACRTPCAESVSLCDACDAKLHKLTAAPLCPACSHPLAYPDAPCPRCRGEGLPSLRRLIALGLYDEPLSNLIQSIKYHRAWEWADALADLLIAHRPVAELKRDGALLIPVPLHPYRRFTRGYNQAELLAHRLSRKLHLPRSAALLRVRNTPSQTFLHSRAKRAENLKDAFALDAARAVRNRHVILVDDVTTTGATLRAAATALRDGRPKSISACVLAIADPKGRDFASI
jgi:ComF family protein